MKPIHILSILVGSAVLGLALGACAAKATSQPAGATEAISAPAENEIAIKGFAFDPVQLSVKVGSTVTWTNQDSAKHTVSADNGQWDSGQLGKGQSFSHTFDQPGTFTYHCADHPSMKATIEVTQ